MQQKSWEKAERLLLEQASDIALKQFQCQTSRSCSFISAAI